MKLLILLSVLIKMISERAFGDKSKKLYPLTNLKALNPMKPVFKVIY